MLSFFEMFHLLEGIQDLGKQFGMTPEAPPPARGIVPTRQVDPSNDPNELLAKQTIGRIRGGLGHVGPSKATSKNVGSNWTGAWAGGQESTARDAELNRARLYGNRGPRERYYSPVGALQKAGKVYAAAVLKNMLGNKVLMQSPREEKFDFRSLVSALNMTRQIGTPQGVAEVKKAFAAIAGLPEKHSPLRIASEPDFYGNEKTVYFMKPQGTYDAPGEEEWALNPYGRQINPARYGGAADTVGTPESLPEAPPHDPEFAKANLNPNLKSKEAPLNAQEIGNQLTSLYDRFNKEYERVMANLDRYTPQQLNDRPQLAQANFSALKDEYRELAMKLQKIEDEGGPEAEMAGMRLSQTGIEWDQLEELEQSYDQATSGIEAGPRREWRYYLA